MGTKSKTHASHPDHELELKHFHEPYTCDGCKEPGFGRRYRCDLCKFNLHEDCMSACPKISHDFFGTCIFKLFSKPPISKKCKKLNCGECNTRYCDACGKPVHGFVYHCSKENLDLHPCCANLKQKINIGGEEFELRKRLDKKCLLCKVKVRSTSRSSHVRPWSYVSKSEEYHLHVHCVTEIVMLIWKSSSSSLPSLSGGVKSISNEDYECLDLERFELPALVKLKRSGGRKGNKYWKIMKAIFKAIALVLLGDPTITAVSLLAELVTN